MNVKELASEIGRKLRRSIEAILREVGHPLPQSRETQFTLLDGRGRKKRRSASALVDRYALRAFDAVQLAGYSALRNSMGINVPVFVCSDQVLLTAAQQEGIPILDPCS